MNSPIRSVVIAAAGALLLSGCAAALRLGAGASMRGAVAGSAARFGAGSAIAGRSIAHVSALRTGLGRITGGSRVPATVSITRNGSILHRGRELATIESDGMLIAREGGREFVVGRMTQNRLLGFTEAGELTVPVARLRGFIPSRGIAIRSAPSMSAQRVEILRGNVTAEILQVRDGWYEIRLPNQSTGWLWGSLLALAIVGDDDDSEETSLPEHATDVLLVLQNGQSLRASEIRVESVLVRAWDVAGREYTFDRGIVSHTVPLHELPAVEDAPTLNLVDGTAVVGSARRLMGGAMEIDSTSGSTVIIDASLVEVPADVVESGSKGMLDSSEVWRSND